MLPSRVANRVASHLHGRVEYRCAGYYPARAGGGGCCCTATVAGPGAATAAASGSLFCVRLSGRHVGFQTAPMTDPTASPGALWTKRMIDASPRIRSLDLSLFDAIPTQTSRADRRALLGLHRAIMNKHGEFAYLEIGSHLGGSIQPYLVDPACLRIYSIDPRPLMQPDDRLRGCVHYPGNSTEQMLDNLRAIDPGATDTKLQCLESDASELDPAIVSIHPMIVFIDGEHTRRAVNSDVDFCLNVIDPRGIIAFHDFSIVYKAIFDVLKRMRNRKFLAYLIEGDVFAIFLDPALPHEDEYLCARYGKHRHYHRWISVRLAASSIRQVLGGFAK
jgi:Methyltransferase domain